MKRQTSKRSQATYKDSPNLGETRDEISEQTNAILDERGLVEVLRERQQRIRSILPRYAQTVFAAAIMGILIIGSVQFTARALLVPFAPRSSDDIFLSLVQELQKTLSTMGNFSLGEAITWLLSLFANIVMWAFVIWSLTFIPFIAYNAFKVSQEAKTSIATKPFKWLQLYASTILPMVAFAVAWNSTSSKGGNVVIQLKSVEEAIVLVLGTVLVGLAFHLINTRIPPHCGSNQIVCIVYTDICRFIFRLCPRLQCSIFFHAFWNPVLSYVRL